MGLGLLFAGISGAGKALAADAAREQELSDRQQLEAQRAKLEEERALRIDEVRRQRDRQGAQQMGQQISAETAMLQNQRDAEAINAANGSQMSAEDAQVLRNNPEARKAYGLLNSTRQTDLEDRATAAEKLGYLDAARETRGQLQTEFVNQRSIKQDENADKRLEAEQKWRERQSDLAAKREDRMARLAEAELGLRRAQAAKADSREQQAAEREARMATVAAMKGYETEIKQLAKDAADPLLAPEQKQVIQQQIEDARRQASALRRTLAGAGIEGGSAPSKPFNPADFPLAGGKSGAAGGAQRAANPFNLGTANPAAGEISEAVERPRPTPEKRLSPKEMAVAGLDASMQQTGKQIAVAQSRGDAAEVQRLLDQFQQQNAARLRAMQQ